MPPTERQAPVFLYSPRDGEALGASVEATGRHVVHAERGSAAARRFARSPATIALIDARTSPARALAVARALAPLVESRGAAMLVLAADEGVAAAAYEHGATHFLVAPFTDAVLVQALRYAERHARRVQAGEAQAHFDPVTGLVNQHFAEAWVDQLLEGESVDPACAILLVAISRFEAINVGYGRMIGDAAMQEAGARIRSLAQAAPFVGRMIVARIAGAQFAVAVAGPVSESEMIAFAQGVGEAFERPFVIGGRVLHLSCRMGVALGEASLGSADALFRRASGALALARRGEPNSFEIVPPGGAEDCHARAAAMETDLRQALGDADGAIEVLYQPQVEIASSRIAGVEALVRWRHPVLGPLSAETVLGVAEGAELMVRLGRYVMRRALAEAAAWTGELADLRVSVNVTAQDMRVADFEESLIEALAESGLPPDRLTLEITESGLVENIERAADMLRRLRRRGIKIAIDDFGTGYSSLSYLKSLPLDTLKVDKSLVTDLAGTARDRVVVSGVFDMARSLGMTVVAEGVETHRQLDLVVREGCNFYQGYLCAPPLTARELEAFVPDWQARAAAA